MYYNLYISSCKSNYDLILKNQIIVDKNKYLKCNVKKFYSLNTMYNVSALIGNNSFDLELVGGSTTLQSYIIPDGNYSVLTLRDTLNVLLNGLMTVSYNYSNNTYTFTKSTIVYTITIKNIKCPQLIGIDKNTEITIGGVNSSYINMVDYSQIIIMSDLNYMDLNQDNIMYDENMRISQILLQVVKQDVEPFRSITNNDDKISYNLTNNNINRIRFTIMNEKGKEITDIGDWYLHLNFEVCEKEDYRSIVKGLMKVLLDIKHLLQTFFFSYIMIRDGE